MAKLKSYLALAEFALKLNAIRLGEDPKTLVFAIQKLSLKL